MTMWNPLNVFSGQQRPADDETSASFDPSRTSDPTAPSPGLPAIGIGDSQVGGTVASGDPRRHPIGFAPPEERMSEPRYRTEISFKRHHELPRASAALDYAEGPEQSSVLPEPVLGATASVEVVSTDSHAEEAVINEAVARLDEPDAIVEETVGAAGVVPFYKREISFRRKRATPGEAAVLVAADEVEAGDEPAEVLAQVEDHEDDEAHEDREDRAEPDALEAAEVVAAEEPFTDEPAVDDPPTEEPAVEVMADAEGSVPFYKREISFRRKHATPDEAAGTVVAGEVEAVEPDALEAAGVVAEMAILEVVAAEPVDDGDVAESVAEDRDIEPAVATAVAASVAAVALSVAGDEPSGEDVEAVAETDSSSSAETTESPVADADAEAGEDTTAIEGAETLPVAAADETVAEETVAGEASEADGSAGTDETPVADAPAAAGRFASRKNRSTEKKVGRRKSGHPARGRKVVGLKIGASQIAASVVAETDAGYELLELARRPLEAGIVVDGEVRDETALASAVKAFFEDEKLPRTDVRIGISSNRIGVRTIDIVGADDEARFDNAVRFKAHEVLPVALHESVLDYRVLEERPGEDGEHLRRILLVVAPRDQVEPYQRMADRAGIKLTGIDLEALGLLRAFVEPKSAVAPKADDTATVVVAIGHESSTLLVAGGGTCEFTRVFDWGGGALEEAIATTLDVRPVEAATILRHLSLSGPGRQYESLDEVTRGRATEAVRARLTPFARELVNSLQFYQTQAESLGIGGIVITGGTSHLEGLSDALHQMIGVDVAVGDPFARVIRAGDFDPAIEAAIGSMAVSIGLAIDDSSARGVNLLPKGASEKKTRRSTAIAVGVPVAAAVPLVALSFLFIGAHGKAADQQAELDAVKAEISALPVPQVPTIDPGVVGDEAVRATAVASLLGGRVALEQVFRDMARVLPENVWLTSLSVAQPEGSSPGDATAAAASSPAAANDVSTPTAVSIDGFTNSHADVARLIARLATLPSLQRVTLTTSQKVMVGSNDTEQVARQQDAVHFVIVADLNQNGGAS